MFDRATLMLQFHDGGIWWHCENAQDHCDELTSDGVIMMYNDFVAEEENGCGSKPLSTTTCDHICELPSHPLVHCGTGLKEVKC